MNTEYNQTSVIYFVLLYIFLLQKNRLSYHHQVLLLLLFKFLLGIAADDAISDHFAITMTSIVGRICNTSVSSRKLRTVYFKF